MPTWLINALVGIGQVAVPAIFTAVVQAGWIPQNVWTEVASWATLIAGMAHSAVTTTVVAPATPAA